MLDVINKAGHRLGTAEIESALVASLQCIEAAVVSTPHAVFGYDLLSLNADLLQRRNLGLLYS